jgi:hypothetical protein
MATIQDLPNELLLETLSYLDYFDMRSCSQATKILRAIAHHPAFDRSMFRSKVVKHKHDIIDLNTLILHPIFDYVFFTDKTLLSDAHVSRYTNEILHTGLPTVQKRVYDDNFTSPPVSCLRFSINFLENKDESAITVGQVLKKVIHRSIKMQEERGVIWRQSHAYHLTICHTKPKLTLWEGTSKCKDAELVVLTTTADRKYLMDPQ